MRYFDPNPILEEKVFTQGNLDEDCGSIGFFLECFGEDHIFPALMDERFDEAVDLYLQMLDSLCEHFIEDEHWCWFDDFYDPDFTLCHIWEAFIPYIRSGSLTGEPLQKLEAGLRIIEQSEAYQNYGIPSKIPFSDLSNAKTFVELFPLTPDEEDPSLL